MEKKKEEVWDFEFDGRGPLLLADAAQTLSRLWPIADSGGH
jgi:hypothetical protein